MAKSFGPSGGQSHLILGWSSFAMPNGPLSIRPQQLVVCIRMVVCVCGGGGWVLLIRRPPVTKQSQHDCLVSTTMLCDEHHIIYAGCVCACMSVYAGCVCGCVSLCLSVGKLRLEKLHITSIMEDRPRDQALWFGGNGLQLDIYSLKVQSNHVPGCNDAYGH